MRVTRLSDRVELEATFEERGVCIGYDQHKNRFRAWTVYFECGHDKAAYSQLDTRCLDGLSREEVVGFVFAHYRQFLNGLGFEAHISEMPRLTVPELTVLQAERSGNGEPVTVGWSDLGDVNPGYDEQEMPFPAWTDYFEVDRKAVVCTTRKIPQREGVMSSRTWSRITCLASHGVRVTEEMFA